MPCYLFTYHAYRSWMPDRKQGFVRRGKGVVPPDEELSRQYRDDAKQEQAGFDSQLQLLAIDELQVAFAYQQCRGHCIATDATHIHVLVSWRGDRPWKRIRSGLKSSLTRRFNRELQRRKWFVDSASRKRVKDRSHFDYLVDQYLPSHRGWKWREDGEPFR